MEKSIFTINIASKKALGGNSPRINDDVLKPGGAFDRQLNYDNPHWPKPVTGSEVACHLY